MKQRAKYMFLIGGIILAAGIILIVLSPETKLGQITLPSTLITLGAVLIAIGMLNTFIRKEIKYDERDQIIALKSSNITLSIIILVSAITMLIGTIQDISIDLMITSATILFGIIIIHKLSHYYLNKK